jgi:hypothetical protein
VSRAAKERRLEEKRQRAILKKSRSEVVSAEDCGMPARKRTILRMFDGHRGKMIRFRLRGGVAGPGIVNS